MTTIFPFGQRDKRISRNERIVNWIKCFDFMLCIRGDYLTLIGSLGGHEWGFCPEVGHSSVQVPIYATSEA